MASPEELHFQHPYLTLGQIHSALAYYWDHKAELDADIERRWQFAEQARLQAGPSPLVEKLCAQGLLKFEDLANRVEYLPLQT